MKRLNTVNTEWMLLSCEEPTDVVHIQIQQKVLVEVHVQLLLIKKNHSDMWNGEKGNNILYW